MTTWIAIVAVGLVSYGLRVTPLLVLGRLRISDGVDRIIRHAGAAAVTALLVGAVRDSERAGSRPAVLAATVVALVLAIRGASMVRMVLIGAAAYVTVVVAQAVV